MYMNKKICVFDIWIIHCSMFVISGCMEYGNFILIICGIHVPDSFFAEKKNIYQSKLRKMC